MSLHEKRKEQMSQLSEQAAMLHANLTDLDSLVRDTCDQYKSVQQLGIMHGALFMASHSVFGNIYNGGMDGENSPEEKV